MLLCRDLHPSLLVLVWGVAETNSFLPHLHPWFSIPTAFSSPKIFNLVQEAAWSVRRNCSCIIIPCLPDAHRCMETKSSHVGLLVVFLFFVCCFFLQRTENVHEAMAFLPLSVAFHFLVGVYWSLRLLEGKVTGSQTAIM